MSGCSILFCYNSAAKGYFLKCIPKKEEVREKWIQNIKVNNSRDQGWKPGPGFRVCQDHFSPDTWLVEGNKRGLKLDAVPTIFPKVPIVKRNSECTRTFVRKIRTYPGTAANISGMNPTDCHQKSNNQDIAPKESETVTNNGANIIPVPAKENPCPDDPNSISEINCEPAEFENNLKENENAQCETEGMNSVENKVPNLLSEIANDKLRKLFENQEETILRLKKKLRIVKEEKRKLEMNHHTVYKQILQILFTEDQIRNLILKIRKGDSSKPSSWSNSTIKKALRFKFSCGNAGYDELLRQGMLLPSQRTLSRRIEHIKFQPGVSDEMFAHLEKKVETLRDIDKECSLALDEVAIDGGRKYDPQTKQFVGDITIPSQNKNEKNSDSQKATHGMVYMLVGTACRWKQIVGYDYTGAAFDGEILKSIILKIIKKAENIGLQVNSVTSDMGASNIACWNEFGITAGRNRGIKNSIPHPFPKGDPDRKLYFLPDVPHVFKNIVSSIINNGKIFIPEDLQQTYNLPTNIVDSQHLVEMIKTQEDLTFSLTPGLKVEDVFLSKSKRFSKMKVNRAHKIVSPQVGAALNFLAEVNSKPEYVTTSWFLSNIAKWFRLMTSRSLQTAISKFDETKYKETISFLQGIIDLMRRIRVGENGVFKPSQKAVMLSTTSIIELTNYLLEKRNFEFVLTSRFTQDCVENLFSLIRTKHVTPNVLQFKYDLRLISVSQYIEPVKTSCYDFDDSDHLLDFVKEHTADEKKAKERKCSISNNSLSDLSKSKETQTNTKTSNLSTNKMPLKEIPSNNNNSTTNNLPEILSDFDSVKRDNFQSPFYQYLTITEDDQIFLIDKPHVTQCSTIDSSNRLVAPLETEMKSIEKNAFYQVAGYLIHSIIKQSKTNICDSCINSVGSREYIELPYSTYTAYRCYKENTHFFVNEKTFKVFLTLDNIYRHSISIINSEKNLNVFDFLMPSFNAVSADHILNCHNLKEKILRRFLMFRLRISNQAKIKEKEVRYDSKSMAMHTTFQ